MAEHNEIGKIGEKLACSFLMKHGFSIIETNYATRHGEIDIIVEKDRLIHFVEVKTVKVRNIDEIEGLRVKPEENLTWKKWRHLTIACESYLRHKSVPRETPWQIDLACVYIDMQKREGKVILMENIHKE